MSTSGKCVLQSWVMDNCNLLEQTTLLLPLRGADNGNCGVKEITKYYRRIVLVAAFTGEYDTDLIESDGGVSFMGPCLSEDATLQLLKNNLDYVGVHYISHLLKGLNIVALRYPDREAAIYTLLDTARHIICKQLGAIPATDTDTEQRYNKSLEQHKNQKENIGVFINGH